MACFSIFVNLTSSKHDGHPFKLNQSPTKFACEINSSLHLTIIATLTFLVLLCLKDQYLFSTISLEPNRDGELVMSLIIIYI